MNIQDLAKRAATTIQANSPLILTALGVAGVVSTAVTAVRATPEALRRIESFKKKLRVEVEEEDVDALVTRRDIFKLTWRLYVPAGIMGGISIAAIIGSQSINARRQAALASGFTIVETALREYQDKTIELQGEKQDKKILDAIAQDHIAANPPSSSEIILPEGTVLCYDDYSGRWFHSTKEDIHQAQNELNAGIINGDMYASLNDFYSLLSLKPTKGGEDVGWSLENLLDINFTSVLTDKGVPALAMGFRAKPLQEYYRLR